MNTALLLSNFIVIPNFTSYKTDYIRGEINRKNNFFWLHQIEMHLPPTVGLLSFTTLEEGDFFRIMR
ncbi:hypothetical protein BAU28_24075 [Bacillus paramycoides]|uniref:Uncharacterized protein n=1 Tax=Bacillus paramycoides TaxID=2026194 RepID=A0A1J9UYD6_9BACI|nr:hypothetical protein BAU28_24075 [Bacillus paramycoides]